MSDLVLDIPSTKTRYWQSWIDQISNDWSGETPLRIHSSEISDGGTPEFHSAFVSYIGFLECKRPDCRECIDERRKLHNRSNRDSHSRATKALRKVRRVSPKEYDAVYSICALGLTPAQVAARFNDNNIAKGIPDRYTEAGVVVLLFCGIDKLIYFWRSA